MDKMEAEMESTSLIIFSICALCVYIIGLYFHTKIIIVSRKEKEMTWKLDVTNSSLLIAHFTYKLTMHGITYIVPDLYLFTGEWFCYASKFFTYYGTLYTSTHSLIVSVMKFFLIVHWKNVRNFGKDKVKEIFFFLNFLHPLFTIALH